MQGKRRQSRGHAHDPSPSPPQPPPERARIHALFVHPEIESARHWGPVLRSRGVSVHAVDDIHRVRRHVRRHAASLDAIVFGLIVPGGEPSDILTAVTSAGAPCGLVLATHESVRVAAGAAARLRADVSIRAPFGEEQVLAALVRAKACADLRRAPQAGEEMRGPEAPDRDTEALELAMRLLRRAGLEHPHRVQAIRLRLLGMTDQGAAQLQGITAGRFRARFGAGLRELGIDDAYGLPSVLATAVLDELDAVASIGDRATAAPPRNPVLPRCPTPA